MPRAAPSPPPRPPAQSVRPVAGTVHRFVLRLGTRAVPLPPGDWVEVSRTARTEPLGTQQLDTTEVGLVRSTPQGIDAFIAVSAQDAQGTAPVRNWGSSVTCARATEALARYLRTVTEAVNECAILTHAVTPLAPPAAGTAPSHWQAFAALREGREETMPATMLLVRYRFADSRRATTVWYHFGVERYGFPRTVTGWHESAWRRPVDDQPRGALIERMRQWMLANFDGMEAALERGKEMELGEP